MFCPKCQSEFKEGVTYCTSCKCDLVDSLEEIKSESESQPAFPDAESYEEVIEAVKEELEIRQAIRREAPKVYTSYRSKYEDNKSSAFALLIAGVIGGVVILLHILGILDFHLAPFSKVLINVVMGTLFAIFIIAGVISSKNSKKYLKMAEEEEATTESIIKNFCDNCPNAAEIDANANVSDSDSTYEVWEKRTKFILSEINPQEVLKEEYADYLAEQIYNKYFEETSSETEED